MFGIMTQKELEKGGRQTKNTSSAGGKSGGGKYRERCLKEVDLIEGAFEDVFEVH